MKKLRVALSQWPVYPVIVVAAFIAHGAIADALPVAWSWRAILAAIIGASLLQVVASLVLRNVRHAAVATTIVAFWLLGEATIAVTLLLLSVALAISSLLSRMF